MSFEPKSKTGQLANLAKEAAADGRTFTSGEAIRALAEMWSKCELPSEALDAHVAEMWNSYYAVRKMYSLHIDQEWNKYYRELSFWKKRKAKKTEAEWKRNHRTQLENEAETAVLSILDDTDYKEIYNG